MAEHLFNRAAGRRAVARSAGTRPASTVHAKVADALAEVGIDVSFARPKAIGPDVTDGVDVVVTMGCGDECPVIPGARVVDWDLPDPAGLPAEDVRRIRDTIGQHVEGLLAELANG